MAKWLRVPAEITTNGRSWSAATCRHQRLRPVTTGDAQQVRPLGDRPASGGGRVEQDHLGPQRRAGERRARAPASDGPAPAGFRGCRAVRVFSAGRAGAPGAPGPAGARAAGPGRRGPEPVPAPEAGRGPAAALAGPDRGGRDRGDAARAWARAPGRAGQAPAVRARGSAAPGGRGRGTGGSSCPPAGAAGRGCPAGRPAPGAGVDGRRRKVPAPDVSHGYPALARPLIRSEDRAHRWRPARRRRTRVLGWRRPAVPRGAGRGPVPWTPGRAPRPRSR